MKETNAFPGAQVISSKPGSVYFLRSWFDAFLIQISYESQDIEIREDLAYEWTVYQQVTTDKKTGGKASECMLPQGSEELNRMNQFNTSYYSLLAGLHNTFNGQPALLDNTIGVMYDLKLTAEKLCATPFPGKSGYTIGPSFEFIAVPGS